MWNDNFSRSFFLIMPEKLVLQTVHACLRMRCSNREGWKLKVRAIVFACFEVRVWKSLHEQFNAIYFRIQMEGLKLILPTLRVWCVHLSRYMVTYGIRNFTTIQVPKPINTHESDFLTLLKSSGSIKLRFPDCFQLFFTFEKKWAIVHHTTTKNEVLFGKHSTQI